MIEVKEILIRLAKGESKNGISKSLGVHRKTIKRYLRLSKFFGVNPVKDGIEAISEELIEKIKEREGNESKNHLPPREVLLLSFKERIEKYLEDGLNGAKILQLLRREGLEVTEASFYRFIGKNCSSWVKKKITVRLPETFPGDYAQCDFGRLGRIYDKKNGKERIVYGFVMTLCFSRHQYVHVSFKQDFKSVIKGCEGAFGYFEGVPKRLIFDNMKVVVTKYNRYDPIINRAFLEYSQHRGFIIDPAPAGKGTGKPQVERVIPYVRDNFFKGEKFLDIEDLQHRVIDWCTNVAGRRTHQTIFKRPIEVFENIEKKELMPYDGLRYDIPDYAFCNVHTDHHIKFLKSLYSLPTNYIGKEVFVRGDSALVKIYYKERLIKIHPRVEEGKRSTDFNDYPKEITPYTMRNPNYQIEQGYKRAKEVGLFIEKLLSFPYPWHRIRSAQKLLRLCDKYGSEDVSRICERFLMNKVYDVTRLERMLKKQEPLLPKIVQEELPLFLPARFEREGNSFNHYKFFVKEGNNGNNKKFERIDD